MTCDSRLRLWNSVAHRADLHGMPQGKRKLWTDEDTAQLIEFWDSVGSVALIAIHMQRTPSSVQTQASRKGLPPRAEDRDRHRRRWLESDDAMLDGLLESLVDSNGRIPIVGVSEKMGRSVDAVVTRIATRHGEDSDVMAKLVAPSAPVETKSTAGGVGGAVAIKLGPKSRDTGKTRKCLSCTNLFHSVGAHNRVCISCKRSMDWEYGM